MKTRIALLVFALSYTLVPAQTGNWVAPDSANSIVPSITIGSNQQASIATGKMLFEAICFVCHGNKGKGDGINAANLAKQPADLTSAKTQGQSNGALFWKISEGNPPMLSFKNSLDEERRWHIINYVRELGRLYGEKGVTVDASSVIKEEAVTAEKTEIEPEIALVEQEEIVEVAPEALAEVEAQKASIPKTITTTIKPKIAAETSQPATDRISKSLYWGLISFSVLLLILSAGILMASVVMMKSMG